MPPLPVISGKRASRVFERFGWEFKRWHGSHMIFVRTGSLTTLSIPDHKELDRGMLSGLIRTAGLTVQEFVAANQKL